MGILLLVLGEKGKCPFWPNWFRRKLVVAVDFEYVITYSTKHYFAPLYYREFVTKPIF